MTADDAGIVNARRPNWHPGLPDRPKYFPESVTFGLTPKEAEFVRGRIEESCAGTLLARCAREGVGATQGGCFWEERTAYDAGPTIRSVIELSRRFSLHVEGIPLLYNLLLAKRRRDVNGGEEELIEQYRTEIAEWAERESKERSFDPDELWDFAATRGVNVQCRQRRFVESWSSRIAEVAPAGALDDKYLHSLIKNRERQLKGPRARLDNLARLLDWNGRVGVGRMDFRWHRVRQMLLDLHAGLAS